MNRSEIIEKVKSLDLPDGSYVVFGSCPLAAYDIREAKDIDLYVSSKLLSDLKKLGWKKIIKGPKDEPYTFKEFEAHANWDFSPYAPTLEHLIKTSTLLEGIRFASLGEVRKWKLASGGHKHLVDVGLIDKYLSELNN